MQGYNSAIAIYLVSVFELKIDRPKLTLTQSEIWAKSDLIEGQLQQKLFVTSSDRQSSFLFFWLAAKWLSY